MVVVMEDSHFDKPYHSKRPHRKSRKGCKNCKVRKVKCDEARPTCRACMLRKDDCLYTESSPPRAPRSDASPSIKSASLHPSPPQTPVPQSPSLFDDVQDGPLFKALATDEIDMKLLWFYTTKAFDSLAIEAGREPRIDEILTVKIPQHAFANPFLMNCVLGLAALQLQHYDQSISPIRAAAYRAKAFEGYRRAIEEARPDTFPALLACSLLLCVLSSQMFRDEETKPLYIIDWMVVWRGIGLIVSLIKPQALFESGMAMLFSRPPIDLNAAALHIPNNLLFMVTSIKEGDIDFPDVEVYYDTLKYLGSLYIELHSGFGPILDLRVITWFTFLPKGFVELAQRKRPRALIIIAYYLTFVKLCHHVWWLIGIAEKEIRNIRDHLGEEWSLILAVPRNALYVTDRTELAKLILGNHSWEGESRDEDDRTKHLSLVDDAGEVVDYDGQGLVRMTGGEPTMWNSIIKGTGTTFDMKPGMTNDFTYFASRRASSQSSQSPQSPPGP